MFAGTVSNAHLAYGVAGSPAPVALNSAAVEMNRGRFSAAEPILVKALSRPGRQVVTVGRVLARLLWQQGRVD